MQRRQRQCSVMADVDGILKKLRGMARPDQLDGMARFGIATENRLGISIPNLRKMAKQIGKDHDLAIRLWKTGIQDAMILASMVDDAGSVTDAQMDEWVQDFNSWDVCDQVCMNLFDKTPLAWKKVKEWAVREEEFVKRAAFSLIACLAWHDREASDDRFTDLFPVIQAASMDDRNYVKKAVSWALRHIGKRNLALNGETLKAARQIREKDSRASRWIALDAIRELESEAVQNRLRRKS
jgi:3-methyladenine DNA glycosylase AlkD